MQQRYQVVFVHNNGKLVGVTNDTFNSCKVHGINNVKMTNIYSSNTVNNVTGQKQLRWHCWADNIREMLHKASTDTMNTEKGT
jgi:hypothetical protein